MNYSAFSCPTPINPDVKSRVKTFINKTSMHEAATWSGYPCTILRDDTPVYIGTGSTWGNTPGNNTIYLISDPRQNIPIWAPPVLSCISIFFQLDNDDEVKQYLVDLLARMTADLYRPLRDGILQTPNGETLTRMAVNVETRQLAGIYPPDPEDPESQIIARRPITGEIIRIEGDKWITFDIP